MADHADELRRSIEQRSARGTERGFERVVAAARDTASAGTMVELSRAPGRRAVPLIAVAAVVALGLLVAAVFTGRDTSTQSVASSPEGRRESSAAPSGPTPHEEAASATSTTEFLTGPCPAPPSRPQNPTAADQQAFDASIVQSQADAASGWLPLTSKDAVNGGWYCGWIRVSPRDPSEIIAAGNRQAVYDAKDGTVVGYGYVGIGFVPIEVADAPGFDPASLGGG